MLCYISVPKQSYRASSFQLRRLPFAVYIYGFCKRVKRHRSFSPLIFIPYDECGSETKTFINVLAAKLAIKKDLKHHRVVHWLGPNSTFYYFDQQCARGCCIIRSEVSAHLDEINITHTICKFP